MTELAKKFTDHPYKGSAVFQAICSELDRLGLEYQVEETFDKDERMVEFWPEGHAEYARVMPAMTLLGILDNWAIPNIKEILEEFDDNSIRVGSHD